MIITMTNRNTRQYFEAELAQLNTLGKVFAQKHPDVATQLNIHHQQKDPDTERLIEATAFLTGKVQQKIDQDMPDTCANLLHHLWPDALKPTPAHTIMQYDSSHVSNRHTLQQSQLIAAGTNISANTKDGITYPFTTLQDVILQPLTIESIKTTTTQQAQSQITITIQSDTPLSQLDLSTLSLYFDLPVANAAQWQYLIDQYLKRSSLSYLNDNQQPVTLPITKKHLTIPLLQSTRDQALQASITAMHQVRDYFHFPQQFQFLSITLPETLETNTCQQFQINLLFDHQLNCTALDSNDIKLNCIPIINLFETSSEPLHIDLKQHQHALVISQNQDIDLHTLQQVDCIDNTGHRWSAHALSAFENLQPSYQHQSSIQPALSNYQHSSTALDGEMTHYLSFNLNDTTNVPSQFTASCQLLAYHKNKPHEELQHNDSCTINHDTASYHGKILMKPTTVSNATHHSDQQWQLLAHLSFNYENISDLATLKRLLHSHQPATKQTALLTQQKINSIQSIESNTALSIQHGAFTQTVRVNIQLDDQQFSGIGDSYLFGLVLHRLLTCSVPLNHHLITTIELLCSNKKFSWNS